MQAKNTVTQLKRLIALALTAALLGAQPEIARAAGDIVSGASVQGAHVVPQISAPVSIPSLSPSLSLGALPGAGTGLSGTTLPSTPGLPAAVAAQAHDLAAGTKAPAPQPTAASVPAFKAVASGATAAQSRSAEGRESAKSGILKGLSSFLKGGEKSSNAKGSAAAAPGESAPAAPSAQALDQAFDGSLKVFLTAHGRDPIETDLKSLPAVLAANPEYAAALGKSGRVRVALSKSATGLTKSDVPAVAARLAALGVNAPLSVEIVPLQSRPAVEVSGPAAPKAAARGRILALVTAPIREAAYLGRSFAASVTKPTTGEVVGGVVSKGPAFILSALWWATLFMPGLLVSLAATSAGAWAFQLLHVKVPTGALTAHPAAFAAAILGSLALETFHGIWINTWQNFQKILGAQRGINYQAAFNFFYMQATTALFRFITWTVVAATVMPWQLKYWTDIGLANVAGTFFGVLGFYGLNTLYDKGVISRGTRSWLQQGRDLFFLVAGTFLFSGSMHAFWILFAAQQTMDIVLYAASRRAKARPTMYVADETVARSEGFKSMYPVNPGPVPSPLKQAVGAVLANPFVKPFIAAGKWAWKKVRGK